MARHLREWSQREQTDRAPYPQEHREQASAGVPTTTSLVRANPLPANPPSGFGPRTRGGPVGTARPQ